MKTTQRRPSTRAAWIAAALWSAALVVEGVSLWRGEVAAIGALDARIPIASVGLLCAFAAMLDWLAIGRLATPSVRRILPRSLSLKAWSEIPIEVRPAEPLGANAMLVDGVPRAAQTAGLPIALRSGTTEPQRGRYRLRPLERGDAHFAEPTLRAESPLRLWRYTARVGEDATVRIYPNFAATTRFDELVNASRAREVGIKRHQRRGEGLEFHQLREYRAGDTIRQIDWKATSRKRELISREYEDERDQRIVFLLDCSRRMRSKDGEISHFDHSLNALILLAHVALKGGDAVGLLSFGEERRWIPPAKGSANVNRLLHHVYDLEPSTLGIDFRAAAEELCRRQRRRALVVLMTHLRDEDLVDLMPAIRLMRRTHYVVVVDLRQVALDETLGRDPETLSESLTAIGAWTHELDRRALHERLRSEGVRPLDVTPLQLGPALVNRYFEVKQGGAL